MQNGPNVDPAEIAKFDAAAPRWWDPNGEFRPLHDLNPARLDYIEARAGLAGSRCSTSVAAAASLPKAWRAAAPRCSGIDLAPEALAVARLHALESGVAVEYRPDRRRIARRVERPRASTS